MAIIRSKIFETDGDKNKSGVCFLNYLKFLDTESVFPGFEGPLNIFIYAKKFEFVV